jgi:shikimate kinase
MNVFLIGFMGSGKTSIGKLLAKQLHFKFIDMDADIERREKLTVSEIFKQKGEDYFRELESNWLENMHTENTLISVGGGTPCFNGNLRLMHQNGVVVYLTLPVEMMAQRVMKAKIIRPIVEPYIHDKGQLISFMHNLLRKREPFYRQADIIFEASNMSASKKQLLADMTTKSMMKKALLLQ